MENSDQQLPKSTGKPDESPNTTPQTPAQAGDGLSSESIERLRKATEENRHRVGPIDKLPPPISALMPKQKSPEEIARREALRKEQEDRQVAKLAEEWKRTVERREAEFLEQIGDRYAEATLQTFEAKSAEQIKVLRAAEFYASELSENARSGRGMLLYGPPGTGKDHLVAGIMRVAIRARYTVAWVNGMDLFSAFRDRMDSHEDEKRFLRQFTEPRFLVISDPLPPAGPLTHFQSGILFQIIDRRYRDLKPILVTMNVSTAEEAIERIGAPIIDRLKHDAIVLFCNWPTFRAKK